MLNCRLKISAGTAVLLMAGLVIATMISPSARASDSIVSPSGTSALAEKSDIKNMSIEDLVNIEVISSSKRPQRLDETASAVYVITQDEIKRSGLSSIPELLRLVPGMQVAKMDANTWAISARGHNDDVGNKLLVLVDGREVYTPLFSGVFWDVQDYVLDDIDRIEVVRGPGATVWGSNAVNGVVNIITKSSWDTNGSLVTSFAGGEQNWNSSGRYAGQIGDKGSYRLYAKSVSTNGNNYVDGTDASDSTRQNRTGFRSDWDISDNDSLTFQGDAYDGDGSQRGTYVATSAPYERNADFPVNYSGNNLLVRWNHKYSDRQDSSLRVYRDFTKRDDAVHFEDRVTTDIEFQHHALIGGKHDLVVGLTGRRSSADVQGKGIAESAVPYVSSSIFSIYGQDEILLPNEARLTIGSKFERNSRSGMEIQPTIRYLQSLGDRGTIWSSISRAARTPSDGERYVRLFFGSFDSDMGLPVFAYIEGNTDFDSEYLTAYELGYRIQPNRMSSIDVSLYYNHYDNLRTLESQAIYYAETPIPHLVLPLKMENLGEARSYGGEISAMRQMNEKWRMMLGLSWLQNHMTTDPGSTDTESSIVVEENSPRTQVYLRSYHNLSDRSELDVMGYYVSRAFRAARRFTVPAYLRLDLQYSWKNQKGAEYSVGARNLFAGKHREYGDPLQTVAAEVVPTAYGKVTWSF